MKKDDGVLAILLFYSMISPLVLNTNLNLPLLLPLPMVFVYLLVSDPDAFRDIHAAWRLQVQQLLGAVDEDQIGTYAIGAKDRVLAASETTLADIDDAATK